MININAIIAFVLRCAAVDAERRFAGRYVYIDGWVINKGCNCHTCSLLRAADELDP